MSDGAAPHPALRATFSPQAGRRGSFAIRTLLIANRGEIACRVIRTARCMGIATVAVFSDADRDALHVQAADRAVRIGGPLPAQSYLDGEAIIAAARKAGADAIHPGYGFLSENAAFARGCGEAGLIFVGPPPEAIHAMGDKARAKAIAVAAGVPVVPGYEGEDQSSERLAAEAERIGYPVLIKASAGGGGRGMRRVDRAVDFSEALASAVREAQNAFGDGTVLIEKLVEEARHIEVQVFADTHGNGVHLGERDCSAQRRHQKVLEEAPSPFVDAAMRDAMGADAVKLAQAVGYTGAGTVEFIVGADRRHFFLEMNTRLQVEHPVTEMVTGLDLVEWQLRVAAGEALPWRQDEIRLDGHAVEARLYAEDPYAGFAPQTGRVLRWRPEAAMPDGVRIDNGIAEGMEVSPYYDPMIAKVIAHGPDRGAAIAKLRAALAAAPLCGLRTNRGFLLDLLGTEEFGDGRMTTGLIDRWGGEQSQFSLGNSYFVTPPPLTPPRKGEGGVDASESPSPLRGGVRGGGATGRRSENIFVTPLPQTNDFALAAAILALKDGGGWFRSTGVAECPIDLACGENKATVRLRFLRGRLDAILVDGEPADLVDIEVAGDAVAFTRDGVTHRAAFATDGRDLWLDLDGRTVCFTEPDPLAARAKASDPGRIVAPVSGLLVSVSAAVGARVEAGDTIAVIEAMKMETGLRAAAAGRVSAIHAAAGEQVQAGQLVAEIVTEG